MKHRKWLGTHTETIMLVDGRKAQKRHRLIQTKCVSSFFVLDSWRNVNGDKDEDEDEELIGCWVQPRTAHWPRTLISLLHVELGRCGHVWCTSVPQLPSLFIHRASSSYALSNTLPVQAFSDVDAAKLFSEMDLLHLDEIYVAKSYQFLAMLEMDG